MEVTARRRRKKRRANMKFMKVAATATSNRGRISSSAPMQG
jgi:hypothetical protein